MKVTGLEGCGWITIVDSVARVNPTRSQPSARSLASPARAVTAGEWSKMPINDTVLDNSPGTQTINGQRAWTRSLSALEDAVTKAVLKGFMDANLGDINTFVIDRVALLPLPGGGHPGGDGRIGPFICFQRLNRGPNSQVRNGDCSACVARDPGEIGRNMAGDMFSPFDWSDDPVSSE